MRRFRAGDAIHRRARVNIFEADRIGVTRLVVSLSARDRHEYASHCAE
ncbi:MAG: hypothetical protein K2X68_09040 [Novosphingobium sp.]|nr:hypothetical protein [Novosphingobium sp.]